MRRLLRIRRLVSAVALAALLAVPGERPRRPRSTSTGSTARFTRQDTDGWTSTASCAPLCSVTNGFDRRRRERPRLGLGRLHDARRPARRTRVRHEHLDVSELHVDEPPRRTAPRSRSRARPRSAACSTLGGSVERSRPAARPSTAGTITTLASEATLGGRHARSASTPSRSSRRCSGRAQLSRAADDEPRGRRAAERRPRLLRRRAITAGRRRAAGKRGPRHRRHRRERWRQRRGDRLRLRDAAPARPPHCGAARRTARRALHPGRRSRSGSAQRERESP